MREQKRADRLGTPFAVLVLDGANNLAAALWPPVLSAVVDVTRDVDVVGWLEYDAVLAVLLPNANGDRSLEIMQRVRGEIARQGGDTLLAALSTRLYAQIDHSKRIGSALSSVDLLVEAFVEQPRQPWRDGSKRVLDIVGSLALLALSGPFLLAVYLMVKWTSPGPAVFRQVRVGRRGEHFTMYKFRTMYENCADGIHREYMSWFIKSSGQGGRRGDEIFKLTRDPRITPVGRFLRKSSLDEFPQFWNVLRGDMSLVGPRPPIPSEVEQYQPWHRRRVLDVKPGITGLWQVQGRSRTTFDEMVRLDLRYARTHSLWTDIKILAATPWAVISGKGAA